MRNKKILIGIFALLIILFAVSVIAESELPIGLQKIIEFNKQSTADFAVKVSFFIAFVAGLLGILSPCALPFLPAYISYTFKEKKNITKMTFVFFLGFALVFVAMGVIAGFIGERSLLVVQKGWLVSIAGVFMILLGIISLKGKKVCSYISFKKRCKDDTPGTFLFGIFFAIGWTACLGPILVGILGIGAILGNVWNSALLLLFYALGNLVPLFIVSMLYDKLNLSKSKLMKGKMFTFSIAGKEYHVHSTNLISGILFILIGVILLIYKGTAVFNAFDLFGTRDYFYSIQRLLIEWQYANILGIILFFLFAIGVGWFLWKYKSKNSTQ